MWAWLPTHPVEILNLEGVETKGQLRVIPGQQWRDVGLAAVYLFWWAVSPEIGLTCFQILNPPKQPWSVPMFQIWPSKSFQQIPYKEIQ